jgi:hypothetical protein
MGNMVVSDFAILIEVFQEMLEGLEGDYQEAMTWTTRDQITEFSNFFIFGFCCRLQGEEIVKVDVAGFLKYLGVGAEHGECPHVVVPLSGRLEGVMGKIYHMMILARETESGILPGIWADRLSEFLRQRGRTNGSVFYQMVRGKQAKVGDSDGEFLDKLV